ncbi:hypothetical protein CK503_14900 [Aliifodinibius salipaludis]|uniref:Uncharacterized protein n=1 Tax=Fodinibius salipaludis TaxID=2032627 RepID=A0A2A2G7G9_9BACT|nr:hypothetical protein [Aliifodinibius salipaludis]PAU92777.1 hypothetical protein CK503_14900 [Aliifodinibius salipaludis]
MAQKKVDELEKKKQELEEELNNIQGELDNSIDRVREDVSNSLDPKNIIRKHPLPIVGASALLGFLLGHKNRKSSTSSTEKVGEFSGALLSELKRLATRKAINFATEYVENILEDKAEEHLSSSNGKKDS